MGRIRHWTMIIATRLLLLLLLVMKLDVWLLVSYRTVSRLLTNFDIQRTAIKKSKQRGKKRELQVKRISRPEVKMALLEVVCQTLAFECCAAESSHCCCCCCCWMACWPPPIAPRSRTRTGFCFRSNRIDHPRKI
jgi:hypothetical protein